MPTATAKQIVKMTLDALREKRPESDVSRLIIESGVDPKCAANTISSIQEGFKAGVQSAVMGTRVHNDADDFYLLAFEQGRFGMRFTSPLWVLLRTIAPIVAVLALVAYVLWRFVF